MKQADIANRLGVSTVTVSKALAGQKGVSEETRRKVRALAQEMGYQRVEAKTARIRRYTIGVVVPERHLDQGESFYWKMYRELSGCAMEKNCLTILEVVPAGAEKECQIPRLVTGGKADALVVLGTFRQPYLRMLTEDDAMPVVLLDTMTGGGGCDAIVSDNLPGGYRMTEYLLQLGHRRIAFVGTRLVTASIDDRFLGYYKALMTHGVELDESLIVPDRDRSTGLMYAPEALKLPETMPGAFFCNCDQAANVLIRRLRSEGLRVPEDVSVVGFDNYIRDQRVDIPVTTYEIRMHEMARKTVHVVRRRIEDPSAGYGILTVTGRLLERGTARRAGEPVPLA